MKRNKRQALKSLIVMLLICSAFPVAPSRAEEAPMAGNVAGDGTTSAADAAYMLRALAMGRLEEEDRPDLDFTRNGEIDATDARAALLYACGGIPDWVSFGERVSSGLCNERLFDHFSYTGTYDDGQGNYKSDTVSVTISTGRYEKSDYHLADIYIQDISCFVTAFSDGQFRGDAEPVNEVFGSVPGAIIGMNGDFYSINLYGPVVRNGVVYEKRVSGYWDIAVLLGSGELDVFPYGKLKRSELLAMNPYQTWVFGPSLLDENGHAKTRFRSKVLPENPRSVLGYFEPGHYAFLIADGRAKDSQGLTMEQLSKLCEALGFARAYNMDGGQSSILIAQAGAVNAPFRNGRPLSDILAIRALPES